MKKYSMETIVGIFVVVGLICVGYISVKLGKVSFFHQNTYTLYARFTSADGLRVGSPVEVFGIEAGKVTYLGIDNERQAALVGMSIRKDVNDLPGRDGCDKDDGTPWGQLPEDRSGRRGSTA